MHENFVYMNHPVSRVLSPTPAHTFIVLRCFVLLPLMLHGAPVWIKAIEIGKYKKKVLRVQRPLNIKMAKAYHTVSSEALCVVTGMTPINLKIEQAAQLYFQTRNQTMDSGHFDNNKEARL
jgi:hypothetical protein